MLVVELNTIIELGAVPRIAPALLDNLVMTALNESSQVSTDITIDGYMHNGRLIFTFDIPLIFKLGDKYEVSIKIQTTGIIIYLGKMIVVKENTDIQNYTPSTQQPQRFKKKNQS